MSRRRRDLDPPASGLPRREFLAVGGATLLCTIGGTTFEVKTKRDLARVDDYVSRLERPAGARAAVSGAPSKTRPAGADPVDRLTFRTPEPAPGGRVREYWIAARAVKWNVAPNGRDEWLKRPVPRKRSFTAFVYQRFNEGFAAPIGPARMPGPTLVAEVGDVIRVHFRNADTTFNQAVTMHPHGVRYTPEYDGAYLGAFTRAGGFVAPDEEFTYTWECTPDSVGVWPYHDHGPNHTVNSFRGLFGALIVRPRGAAAPDVENVLFLHSLPPQVTGMPSNVWCVNGRTFAGNTPTIRAKVGDDVAFHVIGGDSFFHTFHIHGHRWRDPAGQFVDDPGFGPNETITARFVEDNPGRWLYHCHVFTHQDMGMAGWYIVEP